MVEMNDEYFLNLTMKYDERDDSVYPLWAVWASKSEDRYYIDGKDGHFYTHVRTDDEIRLERNRRKAMEFIMHQEPELNEEGHPTEKWMEYERFIRELGENTSEEDIEFVSFEDFKK